MALNWLGEWSDRGCEWPPKIPPLPHIVTALGARTFLEKGGKLK